MSHLSIGVATPELPSLVPHILLWFHVSMSRVPNLWVQLPRRQVHVQVPSCQVQVQVLGRQVQGPLGPSSRSSWPQFQVQACWHVIQVVPSNYGCSMEHRYSFFFLLVNLITIYLDEMIRFRRGFQITPKIGVI